MKTMKFAKQTTEIQRDAIVISLRKAGYFASRETDTLRTDASRLAIGMVWGCTLCVE